MAMGQMVTMNMSADACAAPANQSAAMTMSASRGIILDTAVLAVSFLFDVLLGVSALAVRILLPRRANP